MLNSGETLYTVSVSAPGKVILHGEHAVVYGKTAIAVSLDLRSSIVIKEVGTATAHEPAVHIHLPCVGLQQRLSLRPALAALTPPPPHHWRSPARLDHTAHLRRVDTYLRRAQLVPDDAPAHRRDALRCFLYVFSGILGAADPPADRVRSLEISMGSELTIGAGTGSSASFAVCLAGALVRLLRRRSAPTDPDDAAVPAAAPDDFSDADREVVSQWAYNCERIMHGTPSGIDNATCTFGSAVCLRAGSVRRVSLTARLRVLLVDTRVSRHTRREVTRVAQLRRRHPAAVDCVLAACDHIATEATQILENLSSDKCEPDVEAEYQRLGELWNMNHWILGALGVSHPSLERVAGAARAHGLSAKLTGAGGGGHALVLLPPSAQTATVRALTDDLLAAGCTVRDVTLGGEGLTVEA